MCPCVALAEGVAVTASKFLRVADLSEPPTPGKRYLVQLVHLKVGDLSPGWWPVTGPQHDDIEHIGFAPQHWHPDLRFLTKAQLISLTQLYGSFRMEALYSEGSDDTYRAHAHQIGAYFVTQVAERPRLCRRLQPMYPRFRMSWYWLHNLEAAFQDRKVAECRRCPHRGVPLGNLPRDSQGRVVCPAHGLRWNLNTGRLSPMAEGDE